MRQDTPSISVFSTEGVVPDVPGVEGGSCLGSVSLKSRVGTVVRALAFHQCVLGSIPGPGVICGLSLREVFPRELWFPPLLKNQQLIWFNLNYLIYLIYLFDFDLIGLHSPQLVEHSCSARVNWDLIKLLLLLLLYMLGKNRKPWLAGPWRDNENSCCLVIFWRHRGIRLKGGNS